MELFCAGDGGQAQAGFGGVLEVGAGVDEMGDLPHGDGLAWLCPRRASIGRSVSSDGWSGVCAVPVFDKLLVHDMCDELYFFAYQESLMT